MQTRSVLVLTLALLFMGACNSSAPPGNSGASILISDAWLKALPGMAANVPGMPTPEPTKPTDVEHVALPDLPIYMTIRNTGSQNDRLLKAETDIAQKVELHNMEMSNNQMKMAPVSSIEIPTGGEVILQSGGYHIMLFAVTRDLKVGDVISLTLKFEKAGTLPIQVEVRQP